MLNQEGFNRDIAILEDWKETMTEEEYNEALNTIYSDYGQEREA